MIEIQHVACGINLKLKSISLSEVVGFFFFFYQRSIGLASSGGMMRWEIRSITEETEKIGRWEQGHSMTISRKRGRNDK
jgi:hypothetical protein